MSNQCQCGGPKWEPNKWMMTKEQHEINNCYNYVFDRNWFGFYSIINIHNFQKMNSFII